MRQSAPHGLGASPRRLWRLAGLGFGLLVAASLAAADPAPAAASATSSPAEPSLHTFTDTQGRMVKAQMLNFAGVNVRLKHEDGTTFDAPLASFSPADQDYIMDQAILQDTATGNPVFVISAQSQTKQMGSTNINGGKEQKWQESYRVTLKNLALHELTGLQAKVIVYKVFLLPDAPSTTDSPIVLFSQTLALDTIPSTGEATFLTSPLDMQQILSTSGGVFPAAPAAHTETDKLVAIWVRIYDAKNSLVQEWCSNPQITKLQTWAAAWAMSTAPIRVPGRGGRGERSGMPHGGPYR